MLPPDERLTRRRDFAAVYSRKRSWSGPLLSIYLRRYDKNGPDGETRRFGFVVSKKVSKAAHDRNRVKRRLREICRLQRADWQTGFDVVFVARGASVAATYADLETAVRQLIRRSGCGMSAVETPAESLRQP